MHRKVIQSYRKNYSRENMGFDNFWIIARGGSRRIIARSFSVITRLRYYASSTGYEDAALLRMLENVEICFNAFSYP